MYGQYKRRGKRAKVPAWKRPGKKRRRFTLRSGNYVRYSLVAGGIWAAFVAIVLASYLFADIPNTTNLLTYQPREDITVLDADGRLITRRGHTLGAIVRVEDLPPHVVNAFVALLGEKSCEHTRPCADSDI